MEGTLRTELSKGNLIMDNARQSKIDTSFFEKSNDIDLVNLSDLPNLLSDQIAEDDFILAAIFRPTIIFTKTTLLLTKSELIIWGNDSHEPTCRIDRQRLSDDIHKIGVKYAQLLHVGEKNLFWCKNTAIAANLIIECARSTDQTPLSIIKNKKPTITQNEDRKNIGDKWTSENPNGAVVQKETKSEDYIKLTMIFVIALVITIKFMNHYIAESDDKYQSSAQSNLVPRSAKVIGVWYHDVGMPNSFDAKFIIYKLNESTYLKRINGDGSKGTYKLEYDSGYYYLNNPAGSYYKISGSSLKMYDKKGLIGRAKRTSIN